ncbi:DUF5104 domain-containing protein [[Bacteroides] pectinophilus]|nr:DUF5104 domain-containing protein [[Bacteroides] pectinophilus]
MNKKVKYGIAGACLMLIIFIVYMICTYNPDRYYKSYEEENYAIVMEIIRCFDERDSAALEKMFSNNVRSHNSVRAQIQSAFAIYNSKSSSCEEFFDQGVYESNASYGRYLYKSVGADMKKVVLEDGKEFDIGFIRCVINEKDSDEVGMRKIYLTDPEYGHLAIIGDVDHYTEKIVRRNIDASNGITEEYIDETASIVIRNGKTNEAHVIQNDEESIGKIEQMLQGMSMIPCSEESYDEWDYKYTLSNRKNQFKVMYIFRDGHCCVNDKDNNNTYYTIDDTSTYNELIEFAKSLVD